MQHLHTDFELAWSGKAQGFYLGLSDGLCTCSMYAHPDASTAPPTGEAPGDWRAAFQRRYELGALLARGAGALGARLPAGVDAAAAGGHLLAACLAHRQLSAAAGQDAGTAASGSLYVSAFGDAQRCRQKAHKL